MGPNISIYLPLVLCMVVLTAKKFRVSALAPRRNKWATGIFILLLISVLNPYNEAPISTIAMAIFLGSHYLFLVTINSVFKPERIFEGIFDGLAFLSIIQLSCSAIKLCYTDFLCRCSNLGNTQWYQAWRGWGVYTPG